jgi:hypothetical protein
MKVAVADADDEFAPTHKAAVSHEQDEWSDDDDPSSEDDYDDYDPESGRAGGALQPKKHLLAKMDNKVFKELRRRRFFFQLFRRSNWT